MNMNTPNCQGNIYENGLLKEATGYTLRPGGYYLTDLAVNFCGFKEGEPVLDVGCGYGATVDRLRNFYHFQAYGVEPSESILAKGKKRYPNLPLYQGRGEELPFAGESMTGVFLECSLSLMEDMDKALGEFQRVLKQEGKLIIHDVYVRNPQGVEDLRSLQLGSCLRQALIKEELADLLASKKFKILHWQDHTQLLRQLTMELIMTHGSLSEFWLKATACTVDPGQIQAALKKAKIGYFQLIAQKEI